MKKKEDRIPVSSTGGLGNQLFQLAAVLAQGKEQQVLLSVFGNPRSRNDGKPDVTEFTLPASARYSGGHKDNWLALKAAGYLLRSGLKSSRPRRIPGLLAVAKLASATLFLFSLRTLISPQVSSGLGFYPIEHLGKNSLLFGYFQTYR